MPRNKIIRYTATPEETRSLGKRLSLTLKKGDILAFTGKLGSGKTTMIQGIVEALTSARATSPSFIIVNEYPGKVPVFHFDLYRLSCKIELTGIGWEEYCGKGILLVEWAENIPEAMEKANIHILISGGPDRRRIEITRKDRGSMNAV